MANDHFNPPSKRQSFYDSNTSLEYNPRPASSHHYLNNNSSNPRLSSHGYAQLADARQSYGDVRKTSAHARVMSTEATYDRY